MLEVDAIGIIEGGFHWYKLKQQNYCESLLLARKGYGGWIYTPHDIVEIFKLPCIGRESNSTIHIAQECYDD